MDSQPHPLETEPSTAELLALLQQSLSNQSALSTLQPSVTSLSQHPTKQYTTLFTSLPEDVAGRILSWVAPQQAWRMRRLSRAFCELLSSESFARENIARFVAPPDATQTESEYMTNWNVTYMTAPVSYQSAFGLRQWKHLTTIDWDCAIDPGDWGDTSDDYSETEETAGDAPASDESKDFFEKAGVGFPLALLQCSKLVSLSLVICGLTGPIPDQIGLLGSLKTLTLSHNKLTGGFPKSFCKLKVLEKLSLDWNRLSGPIRPELGLLTELTYLNLGFNNFLSGSIPGELGGLVNLESLDIAHTAISGSIPVELGNLASLQELALQCNRGLTGVIPSSLGRLSRLRLLKIDGCSLSGCIPPELGRLHELTCLLLSGNKLSGEVPVELNDLQHLQYCLLENMELTCEFQFRNLRHWFKL
ncbi:hypothetical protein HDU98_003993 [Podochytrium sp. JEL0797]|nr:hypothetical protein HDU98_003993 [Podochytrium sp. JEL0797]